MKFWNKKSGFCRYIVFVGIVSASGNCIHLFQNIFTSKLNSIVLALALPVFVTLTNIAADVVGTAVTASHVPLMPSQPRKLEGIPACSWSKMPICC